MSHDPAPRLPWAALFGLQGRTALIAGASSGIGRHIAGVYAAAGAQVVLAARRMDRLAEAVAQLRGQGHAAHGVALDVTRGETIAAAFDAAEQVAGAPVDILYNNAGIIYSKPFIEQDEAEIARVFDTNLKGAMLVAQEAARRMVRRRSGVIINIASSAGLRAGGTLSSYCASKAALVHLTHVMALELASKGIRVNAICPGNIATDMQEALKPFEETLVKRTPMRRFGQPDDLDGVSLLLAADAGRYITGAAIPVDGGQVLTWM
ncbi:SDR family oxidoreductase [Caldimonas thermodepolymerans]|uniref:2-deoxy-D-gluconate 3-dehydrogenase n=1 Tax=Caldimonas thermodepolymerans TaxID=215580 RepID=A0A2S5T5A8_9BURK|nr:SDR family oxidoreductase [Caldimonas thermodepolymerans]PPE70136.1 2-deoxy-D-gluconate 3-dehydrogenase [Caldimonas thermodepolymerans]QPC32129.1 SDR family oxidoreductase [Caldimonas thermodepolymerans]RDH98013.1 short-subunit dehydrogenase [Caldimonas thermodepolymerans]